MRDHTLARLQAKIYIKRNFKALFGLYVLCRISYSAVYIILCFAASFLCKNESSILLIKTAISAISTIISAPIIFSILERYKQKHFPKIYNFTQSIMFSVFLGIIVGMFSLVNLLTLPGTWQMIVLVISFIGTGIFAPFYVYNLLTREDTLKNQIYNTGELIRETGVLYFKNLLAFIPLGLLSAVIITMPTYAMQVNAVLSGMPPFLSIIVEEAATLVFTIIAILPVYVEVKLYLSIYFLFAQNESEFDFKEYL
ncbi:MAG: hypothetical protein DBX47_04705 [Clostridiales bacterium]|nr:MAG: hypothetical protein DBX47_04705 [Clostridiales bacterium]